VKGYKEVTMRVLHAAALTVAALLLTSVASAQGLGDAAAAAREKRKAAPAKPTKVYTEGDIGQAMGPVSTTRDLPAAAEGQPASGAPAEGQPAAEGQGQGEGGTAAGAKASEDQAKAAAEAQEKAAEAWRKQLDQARKEEAVYKDIIDKVQLQLNGTGDFYSAAHAANVAFLEENKQKLAAAQAKVATLEQEGLRNHYR
jgi:hypothetical protein